MKKISKSDLRGLTERYTIFKSDEMRQVVGGYNVDDMQDMLLNELGGTGYGFYDSFGNYSWFRDYDAYYNALTAFNNSGYSDTALWMLYQMYGNYASNTWRR
ncbi:MAG: hypothetical protein LBR13_07680 [Dysgonamonadaceae bacterium]|jgi:hypothetical protein|nr:hypothetical protein [Dysgonamonadaceae bacterium]